MHDESFTASRDPRNHNPIRLARSRRRFHCQAGRGLAVRNRRRAPGGQAPHGHAHTRTFWRRPPNLLVAGASGHVARAALQRLKPHRDDFGVLVLLDPNPGVLGDPQLDPGNWDYRFIPDRIHLPEDTAGYHRLLREHQIDIVLDVTDLDTTPILAATDAAGVSYVNTALNDAKRGVTEVLAAIYPTRRRRRNAPHILSSGMNPGVVNIWVWHAFQQHGAPEGIVHFEFDSSEPATGWRPMVTWSRKEFLSEAVWEKTGLVVNGALCLLPTNALQNRESLEPILEPVMPLGAYPHGLLVLHEENLKLGRKLGASSKYLYAIHPRTLNHLDKLWRTCGRVEVNDLELGDNTTIPLTGSDTIGVLLEYPDQRVYYLHSLANRQVKGTNATCAQVAVGVEAALVTLLSERLAPRIYFASDLYPTVYRDFVLRNLPVERFVFARHDGSMELRQYDPATPGRFQDQAQSEGMGSTETNQSATGFK